MVSSAVQQGVDYSFSDEAIAVDVPSEAEANALVSLFSRSLAVSAQKFGKQRALIRYPGRGTPIRIPASLARRGPQAMSGAIVATPELAIAEMMISAPFLRVLSEMIENPGERSGIVRVSDNRQVVVSQSSAPLITNASTKEATRRKREDYWHLPDLERFNRDWQQSLEPGNPSSDMEFSFICCDPKTRSSWRRLTNRYRAIELSGEIYHYSVNLDSEAIAAPTN